jgi:hypothetical protein
MRHASSVLATATTAAFSFLLLAGLMTAGRLDAQIGPIGIPVVGGTASNPPLGNPGGETRPGAGPTAPGRPGAPKTPAPAPFGPDGTVVAPTPAGLAIEARGAGAAVRKVATMIVWRRELEQALDTARRLDRPLFWVRARGDLTDEAAPTTHALRTLALGDPAVLTELREQFVAGWNDVTVDRVGGERDKDRWSNFVPPTTAVTAPDNDADPEAVQMFVIAGDGTVVHALAGFWHPEDLLRELEFAQTAWRLWRDPSRDADAKRSILHALHDVELRRDRPRTEARSAWPEDEADAERTLAARDEGRDTLERDPEGRPRRDPAGAFVLAPRHVVMRRRNLEQLYVPHGRFDLDRFVHGAPPVR